MNVPRLFDIFVPSTVRKPWAKIAVGWRSPALAQHRRPEQAVEVDDVFSNEMVELGIVAGLPVALEIITCARTGFGGWRCSQWARPAKRRSICRGNQESRNQNRAHRGRYPNPEVPRQSTLEAYWLSALAAAHLTPILREDPEKR